MDAPLTSSAEMGPSPGHGQPLDLGDAPIVTLVHGTYARNASWTKAGSFMADAVQRALGPQTTVCDFQWSGANAHPARMLAGDELAAHLRGLTAQAPARRHLLIAHSHGGNVALYALKRHPDLAAAVAGVVTMATPFLHVRRREVWLIAQVMSWVVPLLITLGGLGFLMALSEALDSIPLMWLSAGLALLFIGFGFMRMNRWIRGAVLSRMVTAQRRIAELLIPVPSVSVPLLYAGVSFDEAGMALRFLHLVGNLSHDLLGLFRMALRIGVLTAVLGGLLGEVIDQSLGGRSHLARHFAVDGAMLLTVMAFLYGVSLIPVFLWTLVVRRIAYGGESALGAFLVDVRCRDTPPEGVSGQACAVHVKQWKSLRHSYLYTSDEFVGKLRAWLTGQASPPSSFSEASPRTARVVETVAAGMLVLAVAMSAQSSVEEDLRNALFPTSFDARYPALLSRVHHRQMVLKGEHEIGVFAPFSRSFDAPGSPCRLMGHVLSRDDVDLRLVQGGTQPVKQRIEGFGRVDILLRKPGTYQLELKVPRLLSKPVSTELELVCFAGP